MKLKEWLAEVSVPVYILVVFFALSISVDLNGLLVEFPILVNRQPEGWNLPSYVMIIAQVGNIGPLLYVIVNRIAPNRVKEWPLIYFIIGVGCVGCLLLAFFWHTTTVINGEERSTYLFAFASMLALVDTTAAVAYLPYMSIFKPQYMSAFWVGDGLCGLIPALLGLAQGIGGDPICVNTSTVIHNETTGENITIFKVVQENQEPVFSVQIFFLVLFALMCISGISFSFLHWAPFCRRETVENKYSYNFNPTLSPKGCINGSFEPEKKIDLSKETPSAEVSDPQLKNLAAPATTRDDDGRDPDKPPLSNKEYALLLFLGFNVNFLSAGLLIPTMTYAMLPYGQAVYSLSLRLGRIVDPVVCFLALLIPSQSLVMQSVLMFFAAVCMGYQLFLGAMSPTPPLQGELAGAFLSVSS